LTMLLAGGGRGKGRGREEGKREEPVAIKWFRRGKGLWLHRSLLWFVLDLILYTKGKEKGRREKKRKEKGGKGEKKRRDPTRKGSYFGNNVSIFPYPRNFSFLEGEKREGKKKREKKRSANGLTNRSCSKNTSEYLLLKKEKKKEEKREGAKPLEKP